MRVQRSIVLRTAGGTVRFAQFNGKEHLVAPVVMMVGDRAVWPVNAEDPEFVPLDVLSRAPWGWAGRPATNGHPSVDGTPVSANSPAVLEANAFGQVFDPGIKNGALACEVWLNAERAEAVGPAAVRTMERAKNGEPIEVSVGCWVTLEEFEGTDSQGRAYKRRWTDVMPDHLALLEEGDTGACSVKMGCGVRAAADGSEITKPSVHVHFMTAQGYDIEEAKSETVNGNGPTYSFTYTIRTSKTNDETPTGGENKMSDDKKTAEKQKQRSLRERFLSLIKGFAGDDGTSVNELMRGIYMVLEATEPAFGYVSDVFPDTGKVVYICYPMNESKTYRRGYTVDGDGKVTLADDREEVVETRSYEPVTNASANANDNKENPGSTSTPTTATTATSSTPPKTACGCGGGVKTEEGTTTNAAGAAQETAMTEAEKAARQARVKALIDNPLTPFKAADDAYLMGLTEERIVEIETDAKTVSDRVTTAETAVTTAQSAAAAPKSEAEWMKDAPASVRSLVDRAKAQEAELRTALVGKLKTAQTEYSEVELTKMPIDELKRLSRVLKAEPEPVDYSANGGSNAERRADDTFSNPPDPYRIALDKQKQAEPAAATK